MAEYRRPFLEAGDDRWPTLQWPREVSSSLARLFRRHVGHGTGQFPLPDEVVPEVIPRKLRLPTIDQWNATVQRVITPSMSFEISYVGNKGTHVGVGSGIGSNPNQPTVVGFPVLGQDERKPFFRKFGWTQGIYYLGSDASNNYNALETKLEKRFTASFALLAHYTWAKGLGYDFDYYTIDRIIRAQSWGVFAARLFRAKLSLRDFTIHSGA